MTLPTNDDFSNRELSIEELETIAAGGLLGDIWHGITSGLSSAVRGVEWAVHGVGKAAVWVANGGHSATTLR